MTRVADQPGIVLHTRPYRESSLILSVLTLDFGVVSLIAKGVRGKRTGRSLQPFTVLRLGWTGRSNLVTLGGFEVEKQFWFQGNKLASAFYLAELTTRLLGEREAHPRLYVGLQWALNSLDSSPSRILRSFEKLLLEELGYGLDFKRDVDGESLMEGTAYRLVHDRGFIKDAAGIDGSLLQAIGNESFDSPDVRNAAKRVLGEALATHLGPRPLLSRRLLVSSG